MAQVFLHTLEGPGAEPVNEGFEFLRLPVVGEYVAKEGTGLWYEVTLVVHRRAATTSGLTTSCSTLAPTDRS